MTQKRVCLQVQNKRLTELLRLEWCSGADCLVQAPAQSRISKGQLLRAGSWVGFEYIRGWRPLWATCSSAQLPSQFKKPQHVSLFSFLYLN